MPWTSCRRGSTITTLGRGRASGSGPRAKRAAPSCDCGTVRPRARSRSSTWSPSAGTVAPPSWYSDSMDRRPKPPCRLGCGLARSSVAGPRSERIPRVPAPPVVDVSIHDLGTLGGAVSQAKAVNPLGQVVGTSRDGLGRSRAFLWQENVGIVDLNPLTGVHTSANDINATGEIVGGGDTGFGEVHAYLLSEDTSLDLGTLGGTEAERLGSIRRDRWGGHGGLRGPRPRKASYFLRPGPLSAAGSWGG